MKSEEAEILFVGSESAQLDSFSPESSTLLFCSSEDVRWMQMSFFFFFFCDEIEYQDQILDTTDHRKAVGQKRVLALVLIPARGRYPFPISYRHQIDQIGVSACAAIWPSFHVLCHQTLQENELMSYGKENRDFEASALLK